MDVDDFDEYEQNDQTTREEYMKMLMESISQRGKGEYVCPLGSECRKGGWKDGSYVIFNRNSSFKLVVKDAQMIMQEAKKPAELTFKSTRKRTSAKSRGAVILAVLLG